MEFDTDELLVTKRTLVLFNRVYPSFANFPKAEKFALCAEIKSAFIGIIKKLKMASSVPSKRKGYAQEADGHLQTLKALYWLARSQKYISKPFYRQIDAELSEINKLLSGYIRAAARR